MTVLPHVLQARSDRNSHCDYPRHENQHDSCCLEDKDSKRQQERNLGIVSAHLFKPLGKTSRVARSRAIQVAEAEPSSGEANSFLTPSCFDPAVKCTTVPWSWSSPAASNRKIPQGGHYKGRCGALSPCLRYLMDSNVETGIQKQGHGPETTLPRSPLITPCFPNSFKNSWNMNGEVTTICKQGGPLKDGGQNPTSGPNSP